MSDEMVLAPTEPGFAERVTPKAIGEGIFLFECPQCKGVHFRHAGYVEVEVPFMRPGQKSVLTHSEAVKVCINCKNCFVWLNEQVYDVTDRIDLAAWERTEREAHKATGPGGQC